VCVLNFDWIMSVIRLRYNTNAENDKDYRVVLNVLIVDV